MKEFRTMNALTIILALTSRYFHLFLLLQISWQQHYDGINCRWGFFFSTHNFKSKLSLINVYISEAITKKKKEKFFANKKRYKRRSIKKILVWSNWKALHPRFVLFSNFFPLFFYIFHRKYAFYAPKTVKVNFNLKYFFTT